MRTVVYQSYRTRDVPHWITRCLESVRGWAALRGHDYRFFDDAIFELVPARYREAVQGRLLPMSDLARLLAARVLLAEGADRVVWMDADIFVFDPQSLDPATDSGFAVCPEVWITRQWGAPVGERRVNNAAMIFDRDNAFLDFYVHATQIRVSSRASGLSDWVGGPEFLTPLDAILPLPRIDGVGLFSPLVMHGIANGEARWVERYARDFGRRVSAANLCGSGYGKVVDEVPLTDDLYHAVIDILAAGRGDVVNRHLAPG